jgi:hypothetical protein
MTATPHIRRVAVFFCLAILLLAALTPGATSLPVAILVAQWFFIAIAVSVLLPYVDKQNHTQQALALPAFSPRPPPAR